MDIISHQIKQHLTIYTGEVLTPSRRSSLTGSWSQLSNERIRVATNLKKISYLAGIYLQRSWFSVTLLHCKLHTRVRVVSNKHVSLEIQEQQFFEKFQNRCFNYLARAFSHAFARHHAFHAVFTFLHFSVGVYLSLHHCLKGKFNFWIALSFRYSGGALRTPVKDLKWNFL